MSVKARRISGPRVTVLRKILLPDRASVDLAVQDDNWMSRATQLLSHAAGQGGVGAKLRADDPEEVGAVAEAMLDNVSGGDYDAVGVC